LEYACDECSQRSMITSSLGMFRHLVLLLVVPLCNAICILPDALPTIFTVARNFWSVFASYTVEEGNGSSIAEIDENELIYAGKDTSEATMEAVGGAFWPWVDGKFKVTDCEGANLAYIKRVQDVFDHHFELRDATDTNTIGKTTTVSFLEFFVPFKSVEVNFTDIPADNSTAAVVYATMKRQATPLLWFLPVHNRWEAEIVFPGYSTAVDPSPLVAANVQLDPRLLPFVTTVQFVNAGYAETIGPLLFVVIFYIIVCGCCVCCCMLLCMGGKRKEKAKDPEETKRLLDEEKPTPICGLACCARPATSSGGPPPPRR